MAELVGTLGEGRVLVFQPASPEGGALTIARGLQRFWHHALKRAGRDAVRFVALGRVEELDGPVPDGLPIEVGDRMLLPVRPVSDPASAIGLVAKYQSRWGLVAELVPDGARAGLVTTLYERRGDGGRAIDAWRFEGEAVALPAHAVEVLSGVGRRLGTKLPFATATQAFDTGSPLAAMQILEQLGVLGLAEDDCRLPIAPVLARLAALAVAAPRSRLVIDLVPELLGHLARMGAHDLQLAGWVRDVKEAIGVLPPEWARLVERSRHGREPVS